ncbi:hypothetical protein LX97_01284 [Nonlabens dokdonensis]|jgi:hypothetical protein|uniref:Uncharacterized protein n=2 Tax=Nonlabens dokdonensis TaxID=328515 RepID=L7W8Y6_NONDD|nr:hypothetical protein [Nonlabens dokdonensis]AGC76624.1 hypothetical protein DDD_1497 [Nonlabens dokdonensis DSW-6]PZX44273.1 hypothetical protein LX97_01284 [Nonlabens dokdonensis]
MKWLYSLLFICSIAFAQKTDQGFSLVADSFYGVDDFEAVYYGKDNVFFKKYGKITQQFYDVQLGDLTEVDLINPLKILLFYKDTQTIVILDNRLNERQRILLNELQPSRFFEHARLAGERRFWLHDLDKNRLELYDYINDRTLISTAVLKDNVTQFLSDYNFCHVISDEQIETYNAYGSRTATLSITGVEFVDYDFETLVFIKENRIKVMKMDKEYRFRESEINTIDIKEKDVNSLYLKGGKLYLCHGKRVDVYSINPIKN